MKKRCSATDFLFPFVSVKICKKETENLLHISAEWESKMLHQNELNTWIRVKLF